MNHNSSALCTFFSSNSRARAPLGTSYPHQTLFKSPSYGWFVLPSCDPRLAHLYKTELPTEAQRPVLTMTPRTVDLELRLGLPGQTSASELTRTKKVSKTNQTTEVIPKHLMLTLGHKSYAKDYKKRVRRSKTKGKLAQTKDTAGPSRVQRSKRDYYGPCDRCGRTFLTCQTYASHKRVHYIRDETAEEKKERLAKKFSKRDYYGPCDRCGRTFLTSQTYASHKRVHYIRDETAEEKKERLAKKFSKRVAQ